VADKGYNLHATLIVYVNLIIRINQLPVFATSMYYKHVL